MGTEQKPKVLVIQPPVYDFALFDLFFKPYGLLRLAQWFSRGGYVIDFLDCLDWTEEQTLNVLGPVKRKKCGTGKFPMIEVPFPIPDIRLKRHYHRYGILSQVIRQRITRSRPDIICITSGMTYWYQGVWEVLDIIREIHHSVPVAVGGIYATLMGSHLNQRYPEVCISPGSGITKLAGLLEQSALPVPAQALPSFPSAAAQYWRASGVIRINQGCPMKCDYCASRILCAQFVPGDPAAAARWLERLYNSTGITDIAFYDDALLMGKQDIFIPFLEQVIASRIPYRFYTPNGLHVEEIDADAAVLMKKAGFQEIRLGFESSSDSFHVQYDGKTSNTEFLQSLDSLRSAGFSYSQVRVYILAGLPGQRAEEVEQSVRFAAASGVRVSVAEYSPVPYTALWEESCRRSRFPISAEPLFHNNSIQPLSWEGFTREDMQDIKNLAKSLYKE